MAYSMMLSGSRNLCRVYRNNHGDSALGRALLSCIVCWCCCTPCLCVFVRHYCRCIKFPIRPARMLIHHMNQTAMSFCYTGIYRISMLTDIRGFQMSCGCSSFCNLLRILRNILYHQYQNIHLWYPWPQNHPTQMQTNPYLAIRCDWKYRYIPQIYTTQIRHHHHRHHQYYLHTEHSNWRLSQLPHSMQLWIHLSPEKLISPPEELAAFAYWTHMVNIIAENKPPFIMAVFIFVKIPDFCIFCPPLFAESKRWFRLGIYSYIFYPKIRPYVNGIFDVCCRFFISINNNNS